MSECISEQNDTKNCMDLICALNVYFLRLKTINIKEILLINSLAKILLI